MEFVIHEFTALYLSKHLHSHHSDPKGFVILTDLETGILKTGISDSTEFVILTDLETADSGFPLLDGQIDLGPGVVHLASIFRLDCLPVEAVHCHNHEKVVKAIRRDDWRVRWKIEGLVDLT